MKTTTSAWRKYVADPSYMSRKNITDKLVIAERKRKSIRLNKPVYVGVAILDLSKQLMQSFYYDEIKEKYPGALSKLAYTDTDSLIYMITNPTDPHEKGEKGSLYDTSNYPENHPYFCNDNKKQLKKMKSESGNVQIHKVLCNGPKSYALKSYTPGEDSDKKAEILMKKCKGVARHVVKNQITFNDYNEVIKTGVPTYHKQVSLQTNKHNIYTTELNKKSLSRFDNKRYWLNDNCSSLAYGHYLIDTTQFS